MKAQRAYEVFSRALSSCDPRLSEPNMNRCMVIGIGGGCCLRCAAFCDGECTEPQEFSKTDVLEEFDEEELKEIYEYYPCLIVEPE